MATHIHPKYIELFNTWGPHDPYMSAPKDGFTGSSHHNVSDPKYVPGTVIRVRSMSSAQDYCYFAYLKFTKGTSGTKVDLTAGQFVIPVLSTTQSWLVTNQNTCAGWAPEKAGRAAVAIGAVDDGKYGWFLVGGPIQNDFVTTGLATVYTDDTVVTGSVYLVTAAIADGVGSFVLSAYEPGTSACVPFGTAKTSDGS